MSEEQEQADITEVEPGQESQDDTNRNDEPKTFDAEYVTGLRKEAAKHRTEARTAKEEAQAHKEEAESIKARISELEAEATLIRANAFRDAAITFGGISQEDAELFLTATDEEKLRKQAERLMAHIAERPRAPRPDPTQGHTNQVAPTTAELFAAAFQQNP